MENVEKTTTKAVWQAPEVQEYDATREIQGALGAGGDLLVLQVS